MKKERLGTKGGNQHQKVFFSDDAMHEERKRREIFFYFYFFVLDICRGVGGCSGWLCLLRSGELLTLFTFRACVRGWFHPRLGEVEFIHT